MSLQLPPAILDTAHLLWRALPAMGQRTLVTQVSALLAPIADRAPAAAAQGVAIVGEFSRASESGDAARLMALTAERLGVPTWPIDIPPLLGRKPDFEPPQRRLPPPGVPLVVHMNPPLLPLALLQLGRDVTRGRRIIGYWSCDMPHVPKDWKTGPRFVHEVWTQSAFSAAAMERLMPGKIRVVPPNLAEEPSVDSRLDRAAFGIGPDTVVVLAHADFASAFKRDNPLAAITAFRAAFGDRDDRLLILKIAHYDRAPGDFGELRLAARAPNIRLETRAMPAADSAALARCADIVLSLHRCTGFNVHTARAMALGQPVIATNWSGNLEYMNDGTAALVSAAVVESQERRAIAPGTQWAEPDGGEAVAQLRRLADDPQARQALGERARVAIQTQLTSVPLAAALRDLGLNVPV